MRSGLLYIVPRLLKLWLPRMRRTRDSLLILEADTQRVVGEEVLISGDGRIHSMGISEVKLFRPIEGFWQVS